MPTVCGRDSQRSARPSVSSVVRVLLTWVLLRIGWQPAVHTLPGGNSDGGVRIHEPCGMPRLCRRLDWHSDRRQLMHALPKRALWRRRQHHQCHSGVLALPSRQHQPARRSSRSRVVQPLRTRHLRQYVRGHAVRQMPCWTSVGTVWHVVSRRLRGVQSWLVCQLHWRRHLHRLSRRNVRRSYWADVGSRRMPDVPDRDVQRARGPSELAVLHPMRAWVVCGCHWCQPMRAVS